MADFGGPRKAGGQGKGEKLVRKSPFDPLD